MTDAQRRYMKARQCVMETQINPGTELLEATAALVEEYRREAAKTEQLHTTIDVLRNMNGDGQAFLRIALEQIWGFLGVKDQTAAMAALRRLGDPA